MTTRHPSSRTVALDVDDVLLDHCASWLNEYNAASGDTLTVTDLTDWNVAKFVKPGWEHRVYDCRTSRLYSLCTPMLHAQAGVRHLQRFGYRLVAITHEPRRELVGPKWRAIKRYFPTLMDLVVAKDKRAVIGTPVWLIDDNRDNDPDILFDRPWNRTYTNYIAVRARTWLDIVSWLAPTGSEG